jgi:septal ring factor EnvC (AmiA/AmiB activator)
MCLTLLGTMHPLGSAEFGDPTMRRHWIVLSIIFAGLLVSWGCSRSPSQPITSSSAPTGSTLLAKITRLEQELKLVESSRDDARAQVRDLEQKVQKQLAFLQGVEKERDELKLQLKTRTSERDTLQTHYDGFRKNLKDMLGQADAVFQTPTTTRTSTPLKLPPDGQLTNFNKGS